MGERRATAIAMTVTDVQQPGPRLVVRLTDGERTWTWETELVPHRITGVTQLMDAAGLRWPTDSELDVLAHEHAGVVLAPESTRQLVGRRVGVYSMKATAFSDSSIRARSTRYGRPSVAFRSSDEPRTPQ
jgi:hypothetical protein